MDELFTLDPLAYLALLGLWYQAGSTTSDLRRYLTERIATYPVEALEIALTKAETQGFISVTRPDGDRSKWQFTLLPKGRQALWHDLPAYESFGSLGRSQLDPLPAD